MLSWDFLPFFWTWLDSFLRLPPPCQPRGEQFFLIFWTRTARALLDADAAGFPALLDMVGLTFPSSPHVPTSRRAYFHHMLGTSSTSSPRRCRGIFLPFSWTWLDSHLRLGSSVSPERNNFSSYFEHFFQEISSTPSLGFLPFSWTWLDSSLRLRPSCQRLHMNNVKPTQHTSPWTPGAG